MKWSACFGLRNSAPGLRTDLTTRPDEPRTSFPATATRRRCTVSYGHSRQSSLETRRTCHRAVPTCDRSRPSGQKPRPRCLYSLRTSHNPLQKGPEARKKESETGAPALATCRGTLKSSPGPPTKIGARGAQFATNPERHPGPEIIPHEPLARPRHQEAKCEVSAEPTRDAGSRLHASVLQRAFGPEPGNRATDYGRSESNEGWRPGPRSGWLRSAHNALHRLLIRLPRIEVTGGPQTGPKRCPKKSYACRQEF